MEARLPQRLRQVGKGEEYLRGLGFKELRLRYHGDSPLVCLLKKENIIEATAYHQREIFQAAIDFARTEGIIPAPETAHAIKAAIADYKKKANEPAIQQTVKS